MPRHKVIFSLFALMFFLTSSLALAEEKLDPGFTTTSEFSFTAPGTLVPKAKFSTQSAYVILTDKFFNGQRDALEILFFNKLLTQEDLLGQNEKDLEKGFDAAMILFLDKDNKISQVNMTCVVPGNSVADTVASSQEDFNKFFSDYSYDGNRLKLKSKGSFNESEIFKNAPNPLSFTWNVDLDIPVLNKLKK